MNILEPFLMTAGFILVVFFIMSFFAYLKAKRDLEKERRKRGE